MKSNQLMAWVLRSPFHGIFSDGMLLITVSGRKTGRKYTLPVAYFPGEGVLWIITLRNRTWWRNVINGGQVTLLLKRRSIIGYAKPEFETANVEVLIRDYLRHFPQAVRALGIQVVEGIFNPDDISRVAKDVLFVRIEPT